MSKEMSDRQLKFVMKPRVAVLASVRSDGLPHATPVWYRYEDGAFKVLIDSGSQKQKNVERQPRVELCIDDREPPYHTVIVRGRASLEPYPGAAWREALAIHYLGEERGKRYVESNPEGGILMLRIEPEEYVGW